MSQARAGGKANLLIVEDDPNLRLVLQDNLTEEGYRVVAASRSSEALVRAAEQSFDLLILDLMLPDGNGYALARQLREQGFTGRILMLTARTLEEDVVRGFESGADDYLGKPYRLRELMARVRALLRRPGGVVAEALTFSGFSVDLNRRVVVDAAGQPLTLTKTEFDLLAFLLRNRDRALTRQEILDAVWGEDLVVDPRTVDNFVSSLKKKLGWTPGSTFSIRTLRGVGYRMEVEEG
jgi:DNA-binding response OmpR family regulator